MTREIPETSKDVLDHMDMLRTARPDYVEAVEAFVQKVMSEISERLGLWDDGWPQADWMSVEDNRIAALKGVTNGLLIQALLRFQEAGVSQEECVRLVNINFEFLATQGRRN